MSDINSAEYTSYLTGEAEAEHDAALQNTAFLSQVSSAIASIAMFTTSKVCGSSKEQSSHASRAPGSKTKKRKRLDMDKYMSDMDAKLFRRKYRMEKSSFYNLLDIIEDHLPKGERKQGKTPNGPITNAARLSMALRYCAGGDPLDIADIHGVSEIEVKENLWKVVDAIHLSPPLDIKFPEDHREQQDIANGFARKSDEDINCCVGAIDGILIWINKPSKIDERVIRFGPAKFFCGRKKKFGLNMQAVCDSRGMFLDVEIRFPGAASDFYAFDESYLKVKLEREGFLKHGLCLSGDNAYVQAPYKCTPFRNVGSGAKDAFNFLQSQIRINIECAFGKLVHCWGILLKAIPVNITVKKTTSLVLALCKLHNFCIYCRDSGIEQPSEDDVGNIVCGGGI